MAAGDVHVADHEFAHGLRLPPRLAATSATATSASAMRSHSKAMARWRPSRWHSRYPPSVLRRLTAWVFSRTGISSPEASRAKVASSEASFGSDVAI